MAKYKQKFYTSELLNLRNSWLVSLSPVWKVTSSAGDSYYEVKVFNEGFTCECMGFTRWGKCKHIKSVEQNVADYIGAREC